MIDALEQTASSIGAALVVNTHDLVVAERFSTRWTMRDGELVTGTRVTTMRRAASASAVRELDDAARPGVAAAGSSLPRLGVALAVGLLASLGAFLSASKATMTATGDRHRRGRLAGRDTTRVRTPTPLLSAVAADPEVLVADGPVGFATTTGFEKSTSGTHPDHGRRPGRRTRRLVSVDVPRQICATWPERLRVCCCTSRPPRTCPPSPATPSRSDVTVSTRQSSPSTASSTFHSPTRCSKTSVRRSAPNPKRHRTTCSIVPTRHLARTVRPARHDASRPRHASRSTHATRPPPAWRPGSRLQRGHRPRPQTRSHPRRERTRRRQPRCRTRQRPQRRPLRPGPVPLPWITGCRARRADHRHDRRIRAATADGANRGYSAPAARRPDSSIGLGVTESVIVGAVGPRLGSDLASVVGNWAFGSHGLRRHHHQCAVVGGGGGLRRDGPSPSPASGSAGAQGRTRADRQCGATQRSAAAATRAGCGGVSTSCSIALAVVVFWLTSRNGYKLVLAVEGVPTISVSYWAFAGPALLWVGAGLLTYRIVTLMVGRGRPMVGVVVHPLAGELSDTVAASLQRQRRLVAHGAALVALTVAFAASTAVFNATYRQQAEVDAVLTNGADVTVTTSPGAVGRTRLRPGAGDRRDTWRTTTSSHSSTGTRTSARICRTCTASTPQPLATPDGCRTPTSRAATATSLLGQAGLGTRQRARVRRNRPRLPTRAGRPAHPASPGRDHQAVHRRAVPLRRRGQGIPHRPKRQLPARQRRLHRRSHRQRHRGSLPRRYQRNQHHGSGRRPSEIRSAPAEPSPTSNRAEESSGPASPRSTSTDSHG